MPDPASLRSLLLGRFPAEWVESHLASFQPAYFGAFTAEEIAGHLELIRELSDDRPVRVRAEPAGPPGQWCVQVVGFDAFQFLSTLCNLLTVHGFSIVEGRVFTSEPPPAPAPVSPATLPPRRPITTRPGPPVRPRAPSGPDRRRKLVDVLRVQQIDTEAPAPSWEAFRAELATLTLLLRTGRHEEVFHRLLGRFAAALEHHRPPASSDLEPIDLVIDSESADFATEVRIRARDSLGFLSLTASALALCGIRIVQADIRTGADGRIEDTIWVTDRAGHKLLGEPRLRELNLSLILIEHFSSFLPHATNPEAALLHFSRFATDTMSRTDWARKFEALNRPEVLDALVRVLGESHFLWEDYLRDQPENVLPLIGGDPSDWLQPRRQADLDADLGAALNRATTPDERHRAVQRFKDREVFRADVRAILGLCGSPEQFSIELTDVAEVMMRAAFEIADAESLPDPPRHRDGRTAPAALCALGKFGGSELGFASDLELIVVYDDRDLDVPPGTPVGEHFDRMVRGLREVVGGRKGTTFELDFRLRPYGRGGPPATALTAFQNYYQPGGPAWGYERQALIRLRAIAGDRELGRLIQSYRDRYVFGPEPFDLDGLRQMRQLQIRQLVRPGTINAKYSPGALVDIEYFVQALQIAFGAEVPILRSPNTLKALAALHTTGKLPLNVTESLREGYECCRGLIDALRVVHGNAHDLTLPAADSEDMVLLARRLRAPDPSRLPLDLAARLRSTRSIVERLPEFLRYA
jgi:glutamate-ammonia-ligase adenylyltransferase